MLKRFRLLILVLMAILWFVIILPYFLLQTEIGARYGSKLISHYSDNYTISVESISHSIFKPYEIELKNLTIQNKSATQIYLSAQQISMVLKKGDVWQTRSFDYVLVENGYIESSAHHSNPDLNINVLRLKNITLSYVNDQPNTTITFNNISGSISPWSTKTINERQDSQFTLTIKEAKYNDVNIQSIFLQGKQQNNHLEITNLGGDIKQGFFTMKGSLLADNSLNINQLRLNNINLNSPIDNDNLQKLMTHLPSITIEQLSILNSSIATPMLTIEKGNLEVKNVSYSNHWQLENSDLAFNAQSILWNQQLIEKPLLKWHYDNNKIIIEQGIASWSKGDFKLSGSWQNQQLTIDNIIAGGIRYELPLNWYHSLSSIKLADFLPGNITVKKFTLMPSLIIDTDPNLPFQFTAFEAFGNNINIDSSNNQLKLIGTVFVKADSGTLNTIELNKPDLQLDLTKNAADLTFSALIDQGVLEGKAKLSTTNQLQSLTLNAHSVASQILARWYLVNNPLESNKYTLELQGNLQPLSLDGQFKSNGNTYSIKNNQFMDY